MLLDKMAEHPLWNLSLALCLCLASTAVIALLVLRLRATRVLVTAGQFVNEALNDRLFQASEQLELYRALVEDQGDIIVRRDMDNRIVHANPAFLTLLSRLPEPPLQVIGGHFDLSGQTARVSTFAPGQPLRYEQRIETRDGIRWIAFAEASFRDEETGRLLYQVVGRDITDRRLAEAASEAKSRFLATVSHEIRTPLNGVLGMAQLLAQTKVNAEQTTYIDAIRTSGEALLSLIEQILDFSSIEAGKLDIVLEPFDLHGLCESIVELLAPRAQGKGIEIALHIEKSVPAMVSGDAGRLRQVLTNLCGNAVKFTQAGGVGVTVQQDLDGHILFVIEDTGIGIPADRLEHIFEEFEQGDGSHSRQFEGTGLGLAISRKIIERLAGSLDVRSELAKGSIFTLRLALPACEALAKNEALTEIPGRLALIVGKTPFEASFIALRLREHGVRILLRATPELALSDISPGVDANSAPVPDILIVDAALGEASRALAHLARAAGIKTRIILLSPFERKAFGAPLEAGFSAWLTKPVRTRSLLARLNTKNIPNAKSQSNVPDQIPQLQPLAGYEVLIAEDNDINALLAGHQLRRVGAEVIVTRDGLEAVACLQKRLQECLAEQRKVFDLVLLDMRMPGLDGIATVQRMKAMLGENNRVSTRFIALTANAFPEDRRACLEAGFDAFLTKPLDIEALVEAAMVAPHPDLAPAQNA